MFPFTRCSDPPCDRESSFLLLVYLVLLMCLNLCFHLHIAQTCNTTMDHLSLLLYLVLLISLNLYFHLPDAQICHVTVSVTKAGTTAGRCRRADMAICVALSERNSHSPGEFSRILNDCGNYNRANPFKRNVLFLFYLC